MFSVHGTQVSHITGHSRPLGKVGLTTRQYIECSGARSLYQRSLSAGAAACSVPYCQYKEVCSPSRPNAKQANELRTKNPGSCTLVVYIAGDTLHHQPMGAGHMTVLQLLGPMGFRVLQWCHRMLASTKRTSCCSRIITL